MRIWIDLSAPAHPVVFRPLVQRLRDGRPRGRGHGARLRADARARSSSRASTRWRSARTAGAPRAASCAAWPAARRRCGAGRARRPRFDLAAAHGSNDLPIVARALRVPAVDLFDYEWATFQHMIGCRLARRVIVPDAIPPERLRRYGAGPRKLRRYPGLKEEYFLHDFEPDPGILEQVGRRSGAHRRRAAHAAHRRALPPRRTTPSTPICSTAWGTTRASTPSCCRACASRPTSCGGWRCPP